ncbi:MAG TPA: EamA family transporter, partial [Bacteroidales bacterium]
MQKRAIITGALAICFSATLWGFDGIVLTPRLSRLDIGFVVFILHALPFLLMQLFFYREYRHLRTFTRNDVLMFFLLSLFGGAVGTMAIVKALFLVNFQHLTMVVLLQKLQPVFAITLAALILKERLKRNFILWSSLAVGAGYFLTFGWATPDFHSGTNETYAAAYSLLAAFSFGSSTVFSKKILQKYSFYSATFYRYGITAFLMLAYVLIAGRINDVTDVKTKEWFIFIIIGLTTGSGAIFLYYYGLRKVRAMVATICELFFPISAILFDYLINHKVLSTVQWFSAGIMLFAIVKLSISNNEPRPVVLQSK